MGIDPFKWKWFNTDYSRYRVVDPDPYATTLVEEERSRLRPGIFSLFLLGIVLFFATVISFAGIHDHHLLGILVGPSTALLGGMLLHNHRKKLEVFGWVLLVLSYVITLIWWGIQTGQINTNIYSAVQTGAALLLGWLLWKSIEYYDELVEVPVRVTSSSLHHSPQQRIFGVPGGVANASEKFGQYATDAGVQGEEDTAVLLNLLMKIPGTVVYHGLCFPGSTTADVDHAVSHGSTVFLLDSKMWRWGEYEWQCKGVDESDEIIRTDGYGRPRKNHMDAAADKYSDLLGPGVDVVPLLLMHGKKVRVGENNVSCKGVLMLTADDAMHFIGDILSENMPKWRDNEVVRGTLIRNLK